MMRDLRVCFLGDSFTAGAGDETGLGWVGRVTAAAWARGCGLTAYNLGIRRDTSADILARCRSEVPARLVGAAGEHAFVLCCGANDMTEEAGALRVPDVAAVANLAEILGWAALRWPILCLGPPPTCHDAAQDARVAALSRLMAARCAALGVPFLETHRPLSATLAWHAGAARRDGVHPDGAGYAALAALVEAWPAWQSLTAAG